jgi:uncharacterized protein (DUF342 family)
MPIDWVALIGVTGGILLFLIPVLGVTARFALKPIVEAFQISRGTGPGSAEQLNLLAQQIGAIETRLEAMEHDLQLLAEAREFDEKLIERGG